MRSRREPLFWLLLAAAFAYLPGLVSHRDFWVSDEARYAAVLREMAAGGHWIVPCLNGHWYPDKPPLYFWAAAGLVRALGRLTPLAALAVTWLSALGWIAATYAIGRRVAGGRAARIAALLLIPTLLSLLCAQAVRMDMTLAFLTAWAWALFLRGAASSSRPAPNAAREAALHPTASERRGFVGFYAVVGLAVLTKGPLGLLFTLLPAIGVLAQRRDRAGLRRLVLSPGWLAFALLVGGWLAAAWALGEHDYLRNIFGTQIAARALRAGFHNEPFYFYLLLLPVTMLPWTGLLPRAMAAAWTRRRTHGWDALTWWFLAGFVVISLVRGKLFIYLLPLLPPLAIALGAGVARWTAPAAPAAGRPTRFEWGVGPAAFFAAAALAPLAPLLFPPAAGLPLLPPALAAIAAGALAVHAASRRRFRQSLVVAGLGTLFLSAWIFLVLAPRANVWLSGRALGACASRLQRDGRVVATAGLGGDFRGIFACYTERTMPEVEIEAAGRQLAEPGRVLIVDAAQRQKCAELRAPGVRVIGRFLVVDREYLLLSRTP